MSSSACAIETGITSSHINGHYMFTLGQHLQGLCKRKEYVGPFLDIDIKKVFCMVYTLPQR